MADAIADYEAYAWRLLSAKECAPSELAMPLVLLAEALRERADDDFTHEADKAGQPGWSLPPSEADTASLKKVVVGWCDEYASLFEDGVALCDAVSLL